MYPEGADFKQIEKLSEMTIGTLTKKMGFEKLLPCQASTFEAIYNKENVIVRDLTGTGKTVGFCLPVLE